MTTPTEKSYIEDLDPVGFMAVLDEGGRKFNEEWVELATMGLPRAATPKSRDEALSDLRQAEGLSEELQVRGGRSGYVAV